MTLLNREKSSSKEIYEDYLFVESRRAANAIRHASGRIDILNSVFLV